MAFRVFFTSGYMFKLYFVVINREFFYINLYLIYFLLGPVTTKSADKCEVCPVKFGSLCIYFLISKHCIYETIGTNSTLLNEYLEYQVVVILIPVGRELVNIRSTVNNVMYVSKSIQHGYHERVHDKLPISSKV